MEIDHIFICVNSHEKLSQILINFGLTEGEPNFHLGQGTANHRFFFHKFYVELLYIENIEDLMSPITAATQLFEHFDRETNNASPFGIIFRPCDNEFDPDVYSSKAYKPRLLPPPLSMTLFDTPVTNPLYLYFDFLTQSSRATYSHSPHKVGLKAMTSIKVMQPFTPSKLNQDLEKHKIVSFTQANQHLMEITFDDGKHAKSHDFRPDLPLIFKW